MKLVDDSDHLGHSFIALALSECILERDEVTKIHLSS